MSTAAAWHDLECGSYGADLGVWERLAAAARGPVLDLGCGTGRVALHLARRGHRVVGVDREPDLVAEMLARAAAEDLPVEGEVADVLTLALGRRFPLVIAPMQLVQLLPGRAERAVMLARVADHLEAGGRAALAIVDGVPEDDPAARPVPDVLERDGWVLSSLPVSLDVYPGQIRVIRLRQAVSPAGSLSEERSEVDLTRLDALQLATEAAGEGFEAEPPQPVAPTRDHVGSTVVVLAREG